MNRRIRLPHVVPCPLSDHTVKRLGSTYVPGSSLVEILVAMAIAAITLTVFISILHFGMAVANDVQERSMAMTLVRSQMETIKSSPWSGPYSAIAAPSGYTITVNAASGPIEGLQLITVAVQRGGRTLITVQGYKGQR